MSKKISYLTSIVTKVYLGEALTSVLLKTLSSFSLDLQDCQGYDGAGAVVGSKSGVSA